jgi:hypothetical protein
MSAIVRPCPTHVTGCPCINDDPFANLSSEAPDPADVIRMGYAAADPPINAPEEFWDVPFGLGSCSNADAQDAQDCADGQATDNVDTDQQTFRSSARTCTVPCPDGSLFSYSLKAGAVTALSQALADYLAQSVCLYRAQQAQQCGPTAVTGVATDIDDNSATIAGTVNPNGASTSAFFEWGTSASYGNITPIINIGSGTVAVPVTANLTGLTPGTTYHFRIVAINSKGTNRGADAMFDTTLSLSPLAWWKMEEPLLNPRVDIINGLQLIAHQNFGILNSGPGRIAQGVNFPASFVGFHDCFLETVPNSGPVMPGAAIEVTMWAKVNAASTSTVMDLFALTSSGPDQLRLNYASANPGILTLFAQDFSFGGQPVPLLFVMEDSTWHFYRVFIDPLFMEAGVQIDNGPVITFPITFALTPGALGLFGMYTAADNATITYDETAIWGDNLTPSQLDVLYNFGAGTTWPL